MLSSGIAEKIQEKVQGLVGQPVSVLDPHAQWLAGPETSFTAVDLFENSLVIPFAYSGTTAGYILLCETTPNHSEVAPLIRSIAELVLHQQVLVEALPQTEERLDKFFYDILAETAPDTALIQAEARLYDVDLERPRIALLLAIDDPLLSTTIRTPTSEREQQVRRHKSAISRALSSFYTSSRSNIVAYVGKNNFIVLKDLSSDAARLDEAVEAFKKSIPTVYGILAAEIKLPTLLGVGNFHPGLVGLRQSYAEATSAIELGQQLWSDNNVYHIDDFGVVAPLLSGIDEHNIYFSRELVHKLGASTEVIETLEALFASNMSLTQTAETLGIHRNTLVYRLDRITDSLGLDPRQFDDAVQIKLAILYTKFLETDYVFK